MITPRASTRGMFNLWNGRHTKKWNPREVNLWPQKKIEQLAKKEEMVIFVHGMRNSPKGAIMGTNHLRRRLRKLGYKYPVIGFSYDSDVRGAHIEANYRKTISTATSIAYENAYNLVALIRHLHKINPTLKIRIVAHSLGCLLVARAVNITSEYKYRYMFSLKRDGIIMYDGHIESIHMFGSPVSFNWVYMSANDIIHATGSLEHSVINYYCPEDEVIREAEEHGGTGDAMCLSKDSSPLVSSLIKQIRIHSKDHRFKSYMKALRSFP